MLGHNSPLIPAAFRRFWRISESQSIPAQLSDVVTATTELAQLWNTPYWNQTVHGARGANTALVALEYVYHVAVPAPQRILRVKKIHVINRLATALDARLVWMAQGNITATGLSSSPYRAYNPGVSQAGITQTLASTFKQGTHTDKTSITATIDASVYVPPLSVRVLDWTNLLGPCIWPDEDGQLPGLGLVNQTIAEGMESQWEVEEWPMTPPGA